jgi:hypothetical protein
MLIAVPRGVKPNRSNNRPFQDSYGSGFYENSTKG